MTMTATYRVPPGRHELVIRAGETVELLDGAGPDAEPLTLAVRRVWPDGAGSATVYGTDQRGQDRTVFVRVPPRNC